LDYGYCVLSIDESEFYVGGLRGVSMYWIAPRPSEGVVTLALPPESRLK
jgi:hypothetical protein